MSFNASPLLQWADTGHRYLFNTVFQNEVQSKRLLIQPAQELQYLGSAQNINQGPIRCPSLAVPLLDPSVA